MARETTRDIMFDKLPTELLSRVSGFLTSAGDLRSLSLTSRKLHHFVETEGWRGFVLAQYPSFKSPTDWRSAAVGLATFSSNYEHRALVARYLTPVASIADVRTGERLKEWKQPRGQTMGAQTLIDGVEQFCGGAWLPRAELLVYSVGAGVMLRSKEKGKVSTQVVGNYSVNGDSLRTFAALEKPDWVTYTPRFASPGHDDITALRLIRSKTLSQSLACGNLVRTPVLLGTARGKLTSYEIPMAFDAAERDVIVRHVYNTNDLTVRSLDISRNNKGLIVAALGESTISLYGQDAPEIHCDPLDQLSIFETTAQKTTPRVFSTKWLGNGRVAVGLGLISSNLRVYQVREDAMQREPVRTFIHESPPPSELELARMDPSPNLSTSSVHPVETPSEGSSVGGPEGQVCFSGSSDGAVRLHDLRSSRNYEQIYWNPLHDGSVYSIQTFGHNRLAAGMSEQSIVKCFDIRVTGGKLYDYKTLGNNIPTQRPPMRGRVAGREGNGGWNLFLYDRERVRLARKFPSDLRARNQRLAQSAVYSLCSTSNLSPTLYVGLEDHVAQVDFASIKEPFQDPILLEHGDLESATLKDWHGDRNGALPRGQRGRTDVLNLAMYEHDSGGAVQLLKQRALKDIDGESVALPGLDVRWKR